MGLSAPGEMVLIGNGQNCTRIAPEERPAEAGLLHSQEAHFRVQRPFGYVLLLESRQKRGVRQNVSLLAPNRTKMQKRSLTSRQSAIAPSASNHLIESRHTRVGKRLPYIRKEFASCDTCSNSRDNLVYCRYVGLDSSANRGMRPLPSLYHSRLFVHIAYPSRLDHYYPGPKPLWWLLIKDSK